ncbi:MAG: glycosyltransferase [Gallionellaceae bacterium]|nr:MAG: glycosyltransferase [Gallionellaceae bacterium]
MVSYNWCRLRRYAGMEDAHLDSSRKQPQNNVAARPWIAVFDLNVTGNSPAGSCVLAEVLGLADEFDITVFSDAFDGGAAGLERSGCGAHQQKRCDDMPGNGGAGRVRWVRVPLPAKPGFLRYMVFSLLAPGMLRKHIAARGAPPILLQATQGQFPGADICYAHFCHRAYLKQQWQSQNARGLRRLVRWITHRYNAETERRSFLKASLVVAPSRGLAKVLAETYPFLENRILTIPNPVDAASFARPEGFDRNPLLAQLGLPVGARVLCFAALGNFSHKGLGILLEALAGIDDRAVRLMVVGGNAGEIAEFSVLARNLGVSHRVVFTGFQRDIRPYLWAADLFVLPSLCETFALVVMQAMAAGVPAVVTRLHGVEDYAVHGENAWFVERNPDAVRVAISGVLRDKKHLQAAGVAASQAALRFDRAHFVETWRKCMRLAIKQKSATGTLAPLPTVRFTAQTERTW